MTFERTYDWAFVKQLVTHPKIWPQITYDGAPDPKEEFHDPGESTWCILAKDADEVLGLYVCCQQNPCCWDAHIYMLPAAWGDRARQATKEFFEWLFRNSAAHRIIGSIPDYNRFGVAFALHCGMVPFGVNPQSVKKDGKLWDQTLLGITRAA
jgi:RimJ/RimL family protein N-acetyltransferase